MRRSSGLRSAMEARDGPTKALRYSATLKEALTKELKVQNEMAFPERLAEGYKSFRNARLPVEIACFQQLADRSQKPEVMIIACCDSRVSPEAFSTHASRGFVDRRRHAHLVFSMSG
jgi:hypothetical protein